MIYPENTVLVPKVIGWISAALVRATTQLQEPYISIKEVNNPMYSDPWHLPDKSYAIILPDAYIMVSFPPNLGVYTTNVDRLKRAQEAATETTYQLATLTYKTAQDPDDFAATLLAFYQRLCTWDTDAILINKVHPEDVIRHLLFGQSAPIYSARAPRAGMISPDLFLFGGESYDVNALSAILTQYSTKDVNSFVWRSQSVSFLYPSFGYSWDTSEESTAALGLAMGMSYSLCGYLVGALPDSQASYYLAQDWPTRIGILTSGAIYGNAYFSYLIRQLL